MSKRHAQHSHLTMGGTHPRTMSERPSTHIRSWEEHIQEPDQKGSALTSNNGTNTSKNHIRKAQHSHLIMGGTHPRTILERISTRIQAWGEHIQEPYWKGSALISDHGRNTSKNHVRRAQHLYLTMGGTHPRTMSEGLSTYIWPWEEHIQEPCQKGLALISDHVGTHHTVPLEWLCTYTWSCGNTSHSPLRMALHLHLIMWEHIP